MAVFTPVTLDEIIPWAARFPIGTVKSLRGISSGIENSNFFLGTDRDEFVLTIFEKLSFEQLPFYLNLMRHLAERGVLVPAPIASDRGEIRRPAILTGNGGGLFLPEELTRGADGAMTGFAWPEMMVDVVAAHARGDVERAHDLFDAYLPLARYEQQAGIGLAVRKHLLQARGAIASAFIRKPGPKLSAQDIADLDRLVRRQDKRLAELG